MTGGAGYLAAAYAIVGLTLLGYALSLERRLRSLRRARESSSDDPPTG